METRAYVEPEGGHDKFLEYMIAASPQPGGNAPWYFLRSYITAALWSSTGDDGESLDKYDITRITAATRAKMAADCARFYFDNRHAIHCDGAPQAKDVSGLSMRAREASMAGHDFWLTRCGHGAGFWDGDWPEPQAATLTKAAECFGNVDLYVSRGWIYGE